MEQSKSSTKVGGVDVSKAKLDVAVHGLEDMTEVANDAEGFAVLGAWLKVRGVVRVGLEATGGYERALLTWLRANGFEVVVHQPLEVRLFARLKRLRAKNDRLDARLIAAATAQVDTVRAAADPLLAELAERMTAYEQASDQLAQLKTYLEHVTLPDLRATYQAQALDVRSRRATAVFGTPSVHASTRRARNARARLTWDRFVKRTNSRRSSSVTINATLGRPIVAISSLDHDMVICTR